jgi:hypothetical protein
MRASSTRSMGPANRQPHRSKFVLPQTHTITVTAEMQSVLDRINEIVSAANVMRFHVHSLIRDTLLLTGSFDHCYYHELEVRFHNVAYIGLPIYQLDMPQFSVAADADRTSHSHLELDVTEILFKIHHAPDFKGGQFYYVAAEKISVVEGTVYYYPRDDLKVGERIADWVKPADDH